MPNDPVATAQQAVSDPYGTAAAMGGPGAQAAYQLGKELGAKPPGTVVVRHGLSAALRRHVEQVMQASGAADFLAGLDRLGLTRRFPSTNIDRAGLPMLPPLAAYARPELRTFLRGFLVSRRLTKEARRLLAVVLSGAQIEKKIDGIVHVFSYWSTDDPAGIKVSPLVLSALIESEARAAATQPSLLRAGGGVTMPPPNVLGSSSALRIGRGLSSATTMSAFWNTSEGTITPEPDDWSPPGGYEYTDYPDVPSVPLGSDPDGWNLPPSGWPEQPGFPQQPVPIPVPAPPPFPPGPVAPSGIPPEEPAPPPRSGSSLPLLAAAAAAAWFLLR